MIAVNDQDERYVSVAEAALALAGLTAADLARLGRIAQLRAHGLPGASWEDLVDEAIEKLLSGARRWPAKMPLVAFLREVIRSLASELWRKHAQAAIVTLRSHQEEEKDEDPLLQVADSAPGPEREALARNLFEKVQVIFEGDEAVQGILSAMADGLSAEEMQHSLGLSHREYETCRRRLRRGLARYFPEGIEG
ncbi:sigma-70 family RNA polymerase sigma factor [Sphingomonas sp. SRS2]|uniref:sigma-70 family RNA polymerase sigma factor n=1 Tax=Sphingomonas sp. SRS2 TaxID=133190 RepID=UPI000A9303A2|nr:sigma-70 family RNA polymerase sigma factor [Sphingomonas sp. SRS2]